MHWRFLLKQYFPLKSILRLDACDVPAKLANTIVCENWGFVVENNYCLENKDVMLSPNKCLSIH